MKGSRQPPGSALASLRPRWAARLFEPCFSRGAGGRRSPLADLICSLLAKEPLLEDVVEGVDCTQLQALLLVVHRGRALGHAALGSCLGDGEGAQGTRIWWSTLSADPGGTATGVGAWGGPDLPLGGSSDNWGPPSPIPKEKAPFPAHLATEDHPHHIAK